MKKRILSLLICSIAMTWLYGCQSQDGTEPSKKEELTLIETDDTWGIVLLAQEVKPTGLTLICSQKDGTLTGELQTGEKFWLEKNEQGEWGEIKPFQDPTWESTAYIIKTQSLTQWTIHWNDLYGTLAPGHYRIGKEIQDFRGGSDYDEKAYYAEFEIDEELT